MTWTPNDPLTAEQLEYIRNFGGRFAVTSHRTNTTMEFSLVLTKTKKGLAVNLLTVPNHNYVGFIPINNGIPENKFLHTKASAYSSENIAFKTFSWVWENWSNLKGVTIKGC